jgi:hypothetical protein
MMRQKHSLHDLDNRDKCDGGDCVRPSLLPFKKELKSSISSEIDVTGVWKGQGSTDGAIADLTVALTQIGNSVTGIWKSPGAYPTHCGEWTGEFNGTLDGNIFTVNATSPMKDLDTCEIVCWDLVEASLVVSDYTMTGAGTEVDCMDDTVYPLQIVLSRECSPEGDEAIPEKITEVGECSAAGLLEPRWGPFGKMAVLEVDSGEKLSVECHDGKYYLFLYTARGGETYKVGVCPFKDGCNFAWFWHSGDRNPKNNKPDCLIGTRWVSVDLGDNDKPNAWTNKDEYPYENDKPPIVNLLDIAESIFDVNTGKLTKTDLKYEYSYGPPVLWPSGTKCGDIPSPLGNLFSTQPVYHTVIDPPLGPETEAFYDAVIARLLNLPPDLIGMGEDTSPACDLNRDGVCDSQDRSELEANLGKCVGELGYNPFADIDGDGCLTISDLRAFSRFSQAKQGTVGTQITIADTGFGTKKGRITVGRKSCKVLTWANESITCEIKTALPPPGPYDIVVLPKEPKGAAPITYVRAFTMMAPEILLIDPDSGSLAEEIEVSGNYFGTKKGKIYLDDPVSGKKKICKVTEWSMYDRVNGASRIRFIVPKLNSGDYTLKVTNKVGTAQTIFTVEPSP